MARRESSGDTLLLLLLGGGVLAAAWCLLSKKPADSSGGGGGGGGQPVLPSFCSDAKYAGGCLTLSNGDIADLTQVPRGTGATWNDVISSVFLPPPPAGSHWEVWLYEDVFFSGRFLFLGASAPDLSLLSFNDITSSIKVRLVANPSQTCKSLGNTSCTNVTTCVDVIGGTCVGSSDCAQCCCQK